MKFIPLNGLEVVKMVIKKYGKFMVAVDGTYLNELVNNEWVYCKFDTKEEAEKALKEYNEFHKQFKD